MVTTGLSIPPILPLLQTVFASILEVFFLCIAGYILASTGVLDKKTQKQVNRMNVSLFTPCLLFSKVAFFLSPEKLQQLWIIPIFFVIVTLVSMLVAYVFGSMLKLKRSERAFAMASSMFMNSNSLPIALMQSLVVSIKALKWGDDDSKNAMLGRALTYLVLYSTLGMVLRWSYGVKLLAQSDVPSRANSDDERTPLLAESIENAHVDPEGTGPEMNGHHQFYSSTTTFVSGTESPEPEPPKFNPRLAMQKGRKSTYYRSFPNSPNESRTNLAIIPSAEPSRAASQVDLANQAQDSGDEEGTSVPLPVHNKSRSKKSFWKVAGVKIANGWATLNDFMTVPLWAALASLIVAMIGPLQHALDQHMHPVKNALTAAGDCSIPLTLIVLGAYFYPNPDEKKKKRKNQSLRSKIYSIFGAAKDDSPSSRPVPVRSKTEIRQEGETKTVLVAVASRMIITPLLVLPLMAVGTIFDIHQVFMDPVFVVANVLLVSSPPALTLAQITQAASGDAFERLISRTIFWSYVVLTPPLTILYVVVGLILAEL
ncbi:auxin efflux carrier [Pterulicium gracile]|uniref:Auxin efflux carrier n=1 Tax=Pterulicium gracile TaxID=1884261 RepID=A0A5C3QMH1_9AGAR|nr:auxin efflux carrier [Pterula gracilis]